MRPRRARFCSFLNHASIDTQLSLLTESGARECEKEHTLATAALRIFYRDSESWNVVFHRPSRAKKLNAAYPNDSLDGSPAKCVENCIIEAQASLIEQSQNLRFSFCVFPFKMPYFEQGELPWKGLGPCPMSPSRMPAARGSETVRESNDSFSMGKGRCKRSGGRGMSCARGLVELNIR